MYIDQDIIDSPHCTYSYPQYQLVNSRLPLHLQYHYFSKWHRKNHHQFQPRILKDESFFLKMKNNFENKFWKITSSSSLKISSSSLNVGPSSHNLCLTSCCCSGSEKNIFFWKITSKHIFCLLRTAHRKWSTSIFFDKAIADQYGLCLKYWKLIAVYIMHQ